MTKSLNLLKIILDHWSWLTHRWLPYSNEICVLHGMKYASFMRFPQVLRMTMWIFFHTALFKVLPDHSQHQSGPLTHFLPTLYSHRWQGCSLPYYLPLKPNLTNVWKNAGVTLIYWLADLRWNALAATISWDERNTDIRKTCRACSYEASWPNIL